MPLVVEPKAFGDGDKGVERVIQSMRRDVLLGLADGFIYDSLRR